MIGLDDARAWADTGRGILCESVMTGCCCQGVDHVFGDRTARHHLRRYRKRGPSKPTRMLLEALTREGIEHATLLDIGGGVGVLQHELLDAGAERATSVEASAAYLRAAGEEAERRGHRDRVPPTRVTSSTWETTSTARTWSPSTA